MFELTLSTTIDKQVYLSKLYSKLSCEIRQDAGVVTKQNHNGRAYLALAVDESKKEYYQSKVLDHIVYMIIDDYKYEFFRENLKANDDSEIYNAFLKSVTIFDQECDRDYVIKQIQLEGEILIDSLFYFKLSNIRERWQKTIDIINQNNITLKTQSMNDVLKYLLAVSDGEVVSAEIVISPKMLSISNCLQNKKFKTNFYGKSNFFAEIVKLNPTKINLKSYNLNSSVEDIKKQLISIFGEKIYLIN